MLKLLCLLGLIRFVSLWESHLCERPAAGPWERRQRRRRTQSLSYERNIKTEKKIYVHRESARTRRVHSEHDK